MSDERDEQKGPDEEVEAHRFRNTSPERTLAPDERAALNEDESDDVEAHRWGSHSPDRAASPDERAAL
jgi:hypothetical protein